MIKSLAQRLLAEGILRPSDSVVVGVSGGPDSMALLHLLLGLNQTPEWQLRIHVAHLNHELRGAEAEKDAAFVQAAADSLCLPCAIESRDIRAAVASQQGSPEEIARRERYAFFECVCLKVGSRRVAVGHTADDQSETILHRVLRGTGLRGLAGIPRIRAVSPQSEIQVVRPILHLSRGQLVEYLKDNGIAYREDRTNLSNEPMRNRIRNVVLPLVEAQVNPQVREALTRLGEQASWLASFLNETVQRTFETLIISRTDQDLVLNADVLARKSRIMQAEIVRLAYRSFGLGEQDLSFSNLTLVLELVADPASGKQARLPGGVIVEKRYHQLKVSLPTEQSRETIASEIAVHLPGVTVLPIRSLEITCRTIDVCRDDIPRMRRSSNRLEEYLDLDAVHPPLVVRTRRPGERFFPLGAPGSKKLSDFLIDAKIAPQERERVAVLCDQLGPIWVIGQRIDERVKLTELTRRVLHVHARPLSS